MTPHTTGHCPPKTVLVGVDFGDASARALAIAGVVAAGFDARLRVVHAERFEPPPYFTLEQIARLEAERLAVQSAAVLHLTQFASTASGRVADAIVADEPPVDALLREGATADLIVLGTHGRRGPARWWLGSVAERVVRAATIPVLVTRAAATDPREVFKHLVLIQDEGGADASAVNCADQLAGLAHGKVTRAGPLATCDTALFEHASLVVMPTPIDRTSWIFSDSVANILGGCDRPVLFIRKP
jgi:nucleotide-binding universal stress UspA family protein